MNYRHGDLGLTGIKVLPGSLKEAKTNVLMTGSGGHDHSFKNGKVYFKDVDEFVFGYLEAFTDCKLFHPEHGDKKVNGTMVARIPAGFYALRRQNEETHKGMVRVVD